MFPILFHIGKIPVRAYSTLIIIGFLIGVVRATRVAARRMETEPEGSPRRISPETVQDIGMLSLLAGIIGARVLFVLLDWKSFAGRPLDVFKLWEGGLSLHGGMLFVILFLLGYCRKKKLSFLAVADLVTPSGAITYAFGRVGCFLNGCCYGSVCDLPWAVRFHAEDNPLGELTPPSHPVQLYGTLINLLFFVGLVWWEKRPHRDGDLFWGYIGLYGLYRFGVEAFRAGATSTYLIPSLHFTDTHLISIVMGIISLAGLAWLRRGKKQDVS